MDYTGFIRYFYVSIRNKLNQFNSYKGTTTILNYSLDISNEYLHIVEDNFDGFPGFALNINAPVEYFERIIEYYGKVMPDLSVLLLDKDSLRELYSTVVFNKDRTEERIDLYIDSMIEILKTKGIIE